MDWFLIINIFVTIQIIFDLLVVIILKDLINKENNYDFLGKNETGWK